MYSRTYQKSMMAPTVKPTVHMCFVAKHTPQNVHTEETSTLVCSIDWFAGKTKSLPKLNITNNVVCWTWIQALAMKFRCVLHVMYILAKLHHGINPECNAISRNKMIPTKETEFTWKNMQEHLGRSSATFKRYACKSVLLKLVSDYDWTSSTPLRDGRTNCH